MSTTDEGETLATAGELARTLERSTYGVKKALRRLQIFPDRILGGISYYPRKESLAALEKEMRSPNQQVLS